MRIPAFLDRPEGIRKGWWRVGLVLHALLFLSVAALLAAGPASAALGTTRERLSALVTRSIEARWGAGPVAAPDFALTTFDDGTFRLADQRGRVVVVNFWASWCVPCRQEAPRFAAANAAFRDRGVIFVGVNVQDNDVDARAFLSEFGITYANGPDRDGSVAAAYGVNGVPTTFFINRTGTIARRWQGEIQASQLTGFIEEALR